MIYKLKNIKYDLVKMEKALVFIIQEQSFRNENYIESFENENYKEETKDFIFDSSNGIKIDCIHSPSIQLIAQNKIHLRGFCNNVDKKVCVYNFSLKKRRDKYYNKIIQALEEWDLHVEQLRKVNEI